MKRIPIDQLQEAPEIYPRSHVDWHTVAAYKEAKSAGARFPPVVAAPIKGMDGLFLLDGWHRVGAAKALKEKAVPCKILPEMDEAEALLEAARLNATHGRPMGFTEKLDVYRRLRSRGYSAEKVAPAIGFTKVSLEYWAERRIRVSTTGEEIVLKPPVEHLVTVGNPEDQEILLGDANAGRLIHNLVILLRNDWLKKDEAIEAALDELRDLLCG